MSNSTYGRFIDVAIKAAHQGGKKLLSFFCKNLEPLYDGKSRR